MEINQKEVEIKLPISDLKLAIQKVQDLGATLFLERHLEDNLLFDHQGQLAKGRMLLRMRILKKQSPPHEEIKSVLTFKGAPEITDGAKKREEIECDISGAENLQKILTRLGFVTTFHYQKYRTVLRPPNSQLDICVDETPIGNFFELEGDILRIHEFATKLGYSRDDYITQSYVTLYYRWCQKTGNKEAHMLF
jgi:predicted adenylyl cyclase CyaB